MQVSMAFGNAMGVPPRDTIGRFQITGVLGCGAMGIVYRAFDPEIKREVAIKAISSAKSGDTAERDDLLKRLRLEAQAIGMLNHPNIVSIYDIVEEPPELFIVMEYIKGEPLNDLLKRQPISNLDRVLGLVYCISGALDAAHMIQILHRDVKPSNILLDVEGTAKLVDFGIAKIAGGAGLTKSGGIVGTPAYMAPERFSASEYGPRSDQYSLAVIAYEMLAGRRPFRADTIEGLTFQVLYELPPPIGQYNPSVTPTLETALFKGLAKLPAERYSSCKSFAQSLANAVTSDTRAGDLTLTLDSGQGRAPNATDRIMKNRVYRIGVLVLLAVVFGLLAWFLDMPPIK
jgi:serine/threonine-protein kinase